MPTAESPTIPFFVAGGTLSANAPSYVERQADRDLQAALRACEYCYVLDSRQVGKSSLLIRAMSVLRAEGIRVAACDLQRLGSSLTAEQFYQGLLAQIGRGIGLEREMLRGWQVHKDETPFARFRAVLVEVGMGPGAAPLVVMIDEIELLRRQAFDTDEFLVGIRSFFTDRAEDPAFQSLTVCLAGSSTPDALIQNVAVTPFNIGKRIVPTDFTPEEARPFAQAMQQEGRKGDVLLARVLHWTSGHPYLTQRVCKAVMETPEARTAADVDSVVSKLYFGRDPEDGQHLSFINRRIEADTEFKMDPAALLAVYEPIYRRFGKHSTVQEDPKNYWHGLLKLAGLILPRAGLLEIRNRIYHKAFGRAWIAEHLPNAEAVRQNAARRKGFLQAALLFGAISLVIGILGWNAFNNARIAAFALKESNKQRDQAFYLNYVADMNLIQTAYEGNNFSRIQELLDETKQAQYDAYRGIEWGYWDRLCHLDILTLKGHQDRIRSVAFSPDGQRIVTASEDKTAKVWDLYTGKEILTLKGNNYAVVCAAFSSDGRRIVTGSYGSNGSDTGEAKVWNTETGLELLTIKQPHFGFSSVAFSPDGRRVVTGMGTTDHGQDYGEAKVWDAYTGRDLLALKRSHGALTSVAFSPNGRRIATANNEYTATVWDAASGREIITIKGYSVAFSPDGLHIVTARQSAAGNNNTATVWDARTGRETIILKGHSGFVNSATFSHDGRRIVTCSDDNTAKVWDTNTGKELLTLKGHGGAVNSVAFSPNGRRILTGSTDNTAKVWDAISSHGKLILVGSKTYSCLASFSPDGQRVLAVNVDANGQNGVAEIHDANTGHVMLAIKPPHFGVTCAVFSPNGRRILTGLSAITPGNQRVLGRAKVWDAATGKEVFTLHGYGQLVYPVAFSPDGSRIVTGNLDIKTLRGQVKVWDSHGEREIVTIKQPDFWTSSLAFSPDSLRILTGSLDKNALVWDATSGKKILTLKGQTGSARAGVFSPNGRWIVTGGDDKTAKVWDYDTGKEIVTLKGHNSDIYSVTFSPDGRRILTASADKTVKVWDSATGRELLTLKGHSDGVYTASFSPNGRRILTGSADGSAIEWMLDRADEPDWAAVAAQREHVSANKAH